MSFSFIGARGSFEIPWIQYALIRDNVAHHLEAKGGTDDFASIHRIASVVGEDPVTVPAAKLGREMRVVSERLLTLPVSELAVSAPTRAVLQFTWPVVAGPPSEVVGPALMFGALIDGAETLADVFGGAVESFLELTVDAGPSEELEVFEH